MPKKEPSTLCFNPSCAIEFFLQVWVGFESHQRHWAVSLSKTLYLLHHYTPANFVCGGYTVFTLSVCVSVCACVRPSLTLCFLNILKSHRWIFIKPCKHVHICKTNTSNKKVRARGQFYKSYFPL